MTLVALLYSLFVDISDCLEAFLEHLIALAGGVSETYWQKKRLQ